MSKDIEIILRQFGEKVLDAVSLVEASLERVGNFDPEKDYTPEEREPYDALCDRFIRAVEISIRFMKTYEIHMYGENSDTLRDLMLRMEKTEMISSLDIWFRMRDVRNRIVHDYLPEDIQALYNDIQHSFAKELIRLKNKTVNRSESV
ncbi:nucleotidyltransferase substrate binding protein [bacterium]|nr:nucleotidyltransferase substrate binding protein [candidate division CSSED10-310 bacterium]